MSEPATDIRVRPAQATDVEFLATTGRAMFAVSHGEAMLADDLAAYLDDAFEPSRLARHIARSDNIFLIAHVGDEPAGYVRLMEGPTSSFVSAPDAIEIRRFYVLERWYGRGVAQALMQAALTAVTERSRSACWLHVWEQNARAIAFYEKCGFRRVGREPSPYRSSNPIALVMERTLPGKSPSGIESVDDPGAVDAL